MCIRDRRSVLVFVLAGLSLITSFVVARVAEADHADVIVEKIPQAEASFALEPFASGFSTVLAGVSAPYETDELYLVDLVGRVVAVPIGDSQAEQRVFLDVGPGGLGLLVRPTPEFDERGLLGLAFDPHYAKTGLLYTYTSEPLGPAPDFSSLAAGDPRDNEGSLSVIREWRAVSYTHLTLPTICSV